MKDGIMDVMLKLYMDIRETSIRGFKEAEDWNFSSLFYIVQYFKIHIENKIKV